MPAMTARPLVRSIFAALIPALLVWYLSVRFGASNATAALLILAAAVVGWIVFEALPRLVAPLLGLRLQWPVVRASRREKVAQERDELASQVASLMGISIGLYPRIRARAVVTFADF